MEVENSTFSVFLRCRPLLPGEVAHGRVRYPHRHDTGFSCIRIVPHAKQQHSESSETDLKSIYVGVANNNATSSSSSASALYILDPDAVLGPSVRCCSLHNPNVAAAAASSSSPCIFERRFQSDGIFSPQATNSDIYTAIVKPLIDEREGGALFGRNGCFLCHGVTASGKSHTVFGSHTDAGVVEYAVRELCDVAFFQRQQQQQQQQKNSKKGQQQTQPTPATTTIAARSSSSSSVTTVHVSFVEIYNERIVDLLAVAHSNNNSHHNSGPDFVVSSSEYAKQILSLPADAALVELADHPTKGTIMTSCTELLVTSEHQVHALLELGRSRRTSASTAANERSSRSHAVVTLTVTRRMRDSSNGELASARLTFADLAGSERSDASVFSNAALWTGATDGATELLGDNATTKIQGSNKKQQQQGSTAFHSRDGGSNNNNIQNRNNNINNALRAALATERLRREGSNINKSLFALGACISALAKQSAARAAGLPEDKVNSIVVPYRNSKLTRLLRDGLGGNTQTVILATISPSVLSYSETLATLRFAETARTVSRKAGAAVRANRSRDASGEQMRQLYRKELQSLQAEVAHLRSVTSAAAAATAAATAQQRQRQLLQQKQATAPAPAPAVAMSSFPVLLPVAQQEQEQEQQQQQRRTEHKVAASSSVRTLKSFLLEEPKDDESDAAPMQRIALVQRQQQQKQKQPSSLPPPPPQPPRKKSPSVSFARGIEQEAERGARQQQRAPPSSWNDDNRHRSISVETAPETVRAFSVATTAAAVAEEENEADCKQKAKSVISAVEKGVRLCELLLKQQQQQQQPDEVEQQATASWMARPAAKSTTTTTATTRLVAPSWAPLMKQPQQHIDGYSSPPQSSTAETAQQRVVHLRSPFFFHSPPQNQQHEQQQPPENESFDEDDNDSQQQQRHNDDDDLSTPLQRVKAILAREAQLRAKNGLPLPDFLTGAARWVAEMS